MLIKKQFKNTEEFWKAISYHDRGRLKIQRGSVPKFKEVYQGCWFVFLNGDAFQFTKILDLEGFIDAVDNAKYSYYDNRDRNEIYQEIKKPFNGNYGFYGPFMSLYEAKKFTIQGRLRYIDNFVFKSTLGLNDPEVKELIKKKLGYEKTKKALRRLNYVYPEYVI